MTKLSFSNNDIKNNIVVATYDSTKFICMDENTYINFIIKDLTLCDYKINNYQNYIDKSNKLILELNDKNSILQTKLIICDSIKNNSEIIIETQSIIIDDLDNVYNELDSIYKIQLHNNNDLIDKNKKQKRIIITSIILNILLTTILIL